MRRGLKNARNDNFKANQVLPLRGEPCREATSI